MAKKAEIVEGIKRAKDGLDVLQDLHRYAESGDYSAIEADDFERLKWYGVYRQKPNEGHFMLRIKIPGGAMTATKLREIGRLTQKYARNFGDITTRQDIQLHWLTVDNFPDVFSVIYDKLGMYQEFSCGDAPRNVTGCPLAGLLADEIVDSSGVAEAVSDLYRAGGKEYSNLPRKHKTAVCGCPIHCAAPQINEIGLFGVQREKDGNVERGFGVCVGGGLRDTPHYGQSLRVFLKNDMQLIRDVIHNITCIYRDQDSLRKGRLKARLKFYVAEIGWKAFRDQLEEYLGYKLDHDDSITDPAGASHGDHLGVGDLNNGLKYVGVPIPRGRLTGDQMVQLADLAEKYSADQERSINTTIKQNLILLNIPPERVDDLLGELDGIGLPAQTHALRGPLLSCTGTQFCNLAIVETKDRAKGILDYLESNIEMDEPVFVSVTGCPNSCAQYQIADIGLQGTLFTYKGEKGVEHYHMLVGGRMGTDAEFGRFICRNEGKKKVKVPAELVHLSIERLIKTYQGEKSNGDTFSEWAWRQDLERLADIVEPQE